MSPERALVCAMMEPGACGDANLGIRIGSERWGDEAGRTPNPNTQATPRRFIGDQCPEDIPRSDSDSQHNDWHVQEIPLETFSRLPDALRDGRQGDPMRLALFALYCYCFANGVGCTKPSTLPEKPPPANVSLGYSVPTLEPDVPSDFSSVCQQRLARDGHNKIVYYKAFLSDSVLDKDPLIEYRKHRKGHLFFSCSADDKNTWLVSFPPTVIGKNSKVSVIATGAVAPGNTGKHLKVITSTVYQVSL